MENPQVIQDDSARRKFQALIMGSQAFGQGLGALGEGLRRMRERQKQIETEEVTKRLAKKYGAQVTQWESSGTPAPIEQRQGFFTRLMMEGAQENPAAAAMAGQLIQQADPTLSQKLEPTNPKDAKSTALLQFLGAAASQASGDPEVMEELLNGLPQQALEGASDFALGKYWDTFAQARESAVRQVKLRIQSDIEAPGTRIEDQIARAEEALKGGPDGTGRKWSIKERGALNLILSELKGSVDKENAAYHSLIGALRVTIDENQATKTAFEDKDKPVTRVIYEYLSKNKDIVDALNTLAIKEATSDKRADALSVFQDRVVAEISKKAETKQPGKSQESISLEPIIRMFRDTLTPKAFGLLASKMVAEHKNELSSPAWSESLLQLQKAKSLAAQKAKRSE